MQFVLTNGKAHSQTEAPRKIPARRRISIRKVPRKRTAANRFPLSEFAFLQRLVARCAL